MAKKNNTKKISSAKKKEILVSLANNQDKAKKDIAKSMGISERSLYYILKENHDEYYKIMQEIEEKIKIKAIVTLGKCLSSLTAEKLENSSAIQLANVVKNLHDITSNQTVQTVIINQTFPKSREELIGYITDKEVNK